MSDSYKDHSAHSRLVRFWKPQGAVPLHHYEWNHGQEVCRTLKSPHEGYTVAVYFSQVPSVPGMILVRSTNWRTEHEPRVWVPVAEARAFYQVLAKAGFVKQS